MHHASEHRKKGVLNHPAGTLIWQSANHSDQIGFNKGAIQKRKKKLEISKPGLIFSKVAQNDARSFKKK